MNRPLPGIQNSGPDVNEKHPISYEQLYDILMSTIPSSVLILDRHLRIMAANHNFLLKAGRSAETTVGQPLRKVFPDVILKDARLAQLLQQVIQTQQAVRGERLSYRAPGVPLRMYYYSIVPLIRDNRAEQIVLLMDDVTEQARLSEEIRQVERHLATIVESAGDIIVSTDSDGRILTWNSAAERSTGWTFDEVREGCLHEVFAPEHRPLVKSIFDDKIEPETLGHPEWELLTKEGRCVPVSWAFSALKGERCMVGLVAIGRDLTERHKLEAQVIQAQKLASLGVMAGGIAHEIRNPLAVCSSAAQFLSAEELDPRFVRECAEQIHAACQRASFIIENLLRFARPSEAKNMEPVSLVAIVRHTLSLVENEARLNKVQVVTSLPARPLWVSGKASMLQQMLLNLVFNAFKAMPGGGVLEMALRQEDSSAVIVVKDTGCGIDHESIDKIFDPFYTTRPPGEGTGLGLPLCYSVVSQHSGSIEVESAPGEGAAFTVRLPLTEHAGEGK